VFDEVEARRFHRVTLDGPVFLRGDLAELDPRTRSPEHGIYPISRGHQIRVADKLDHR